MLTMTGRDGELAAELDGALRLALVDGGHADGSFETWLIPAGGADSLTAQRRKQAEQKWGLGADCEVMANLIEAVARYHAVTGRAGEYLGPAGRAADYLLRHQRPDGSWPATWYQTDLYGTWVSARALTRLRPQAADARARAAGYVTGAQLPDGGWSSFSGCAESDATATALALLALADCGLAGAHPDVAARGRAWLQAAATDSGAGWPSSVLIRMQPGRASGLTLPELTFGCPSITASLVLRAALRYDAVDSGAPGPPWPWETTRVAPVAQPVG